MRWRAGRVGESPAAGNKPGLQECCRKNSCVVRERGRLCSYKAVYEILRGQPVPQGSGVSGSQALDRDTSLDKSWRPNTLQPPRQGAMPRTHERIQSEAHRKRAAEEKESVHWPRGGTGGGAQAEASCNEAGWSHCAKCCLSGGHSHRCEPGKGE